MALNVFGKIMQLVGVITVLQRRELTNGVKENSEVCMNFGFCLTTKLDNQWKNDKLWSEIKSQHGTALEVADMNFSEMQMKREASKMQRNREI